MVSGMMGHVGSGGTGSGELLSRLGIEVGKLNAEFETLPLSINELLQAFKEVSSQSNLGPLVGEGRVGGPTVGGPSGGGATGATLPQGSLGHMTSFRRGVMTGLLVRLAYIAALKAAIDKATQSGNTFNLETAINDLWVHLESVKKMAAPASTAAVNNTVTIETAKMRDMIEKRAQMFQLLSDIMRRYDDTAKSITSNMR